MRMEPWKRCRNIVSSPAPGEGVIPLYKLYRHVPPHRVGFLCRFGLKTGIHFADFGLESVFHSKWERKKERKKERELDMRIRNGFKEFFVCSLI